MTIGAQEIARLSRGLRWMTGTVGAALTVYVTLALFGYVRSHKAVHPDFSEETAYQILMSVAKLAPKLSDLHILWKGWSPELMVAGLSDENVHPGAKKAYVELGWWDKTKNYPAMTYPVI